VELYLAPSILCLGGVFLIHFRKECVTMQRHVLSILVDNHAGVLSRVSGLFSRRGYNIDSLSVGETENSAFSRITVVVRCDDPVLDQICKQVEKLVDVTQVVILSDDGSVYRELALIKVMTTAETRPQIVSLVDIFRGNIIDVSKTTLTIEITGDQDKIDAFFALMEPFGIKELVRTGLTGIQRGNIGIRG